MQVNLLPYLVETLGNNKKIYKDINRIYQKNKYEFYKAAKNNELYNHQIVKEGSLVQEEYCRKVLGIILEAEKKESIYSDVFNLIRKGFRYSYVYLNKNLKIDFKKFANAFVKKHNGFTDNFGVSVEHHIVILLFLALNNKTEYVDNEFYNEFINNLKERWEHYKDSEPTRISLDKIKETDKEMINQLKKAIYKKYGEIRCFDDTLDSKFENNEMNPVAFLFDYENLSSVSIFEDVQFTNRDIDEILYLYIMSNNKLHTRPEQDMYTIANLIDADVIKDSTKFLISNMHTRYMLKAYKQVKEMYFENNKETMFVELEGLEKSLHSMEQKLFLSKKVNSDLEKKVILLEKENDRFKNELEQEKRNREELNSLREFLFNLDNQENHIQDTTFDLNMLKEYKSIIIGGHEKWQQRMKELLPNFIFIHPDNMNFDTRLLNGLEILFVYVNYLNHGLYYKVMESIAGKSIKVKYLNQQNEDLVLKEIFNKINQS